LLGILAFGGGGLRRQFFKEGLGVVSPSIERVVGLSGESSVVFHKILI